MIINILYQEGVLGYTFESIKKNEGSKSGWLDWSDGGKVMKGGNLKTNVVMGATSVYFLNH